MWPQSLMHVMFLSQRTLSTKMLTGSFPSLFSPWDLGEKKHPVSGVYRTCLNDWVGLGSTLEPLCRQTLADRETAGTATKAASTTTAGRELLSMGLGTTRAGKQWFQEGRDSLSFSTLKIHLMWISIAELFKLTLLCQLKCKQVSKPTFCAHLGD